MTSETFFFVNSLFIKLNFIFSLIGKTLASKNLPAVLVYFSFTLFPSLSIVSKVETILECKLIDLFSSACSISSTVEKIYLGFFSQSSA